MLDARKASRLSAIEMRTPAARRQPAQLGAQLILGGCLSLQQVAQHFAEFSLQFAQHLLQRFTVGGLQILAHRLLLGRVSAKVHWKQAIEGFAVALRFDECGAQGNAESFALGNRHIAGCQKSIAAFGN